MYFISFSLLVSLYHGFALLFLKSITLTSYFTYLMRMSIIFALELRLLGMGHLAVPVILGTWITIYS